MQTRRNRLRLRLKWFAILMCLCFVRRTQASLTLFIYRKFLVEEMGLHVQNDVKLIDRGEKHEVFRNPKLFRETTKPLPASINRFELTWFSSQQEEKYSLRVTSDDLKIMQDPDIKLPKLKGTVSTSPKTFSVCLRCTGIVQGQVDIHFELNYTNYKKSIGKTLHRSLKFTVAKVCDQSVEKGNTESSNKRPVDRTVVVTVSSSLALLVCLVIAAVFWRYVKRIRRRFGVDEVREQLAQRRESFTSSSISIPATPTVPTVVYSPKRNGSKHCFTTIAKHDNLRPAITSQGHTSHSRGSPVNLTASSPVSLNSSSNGGSSSRDLKLFPKISITDDDVFGPEQNDDALIPNEKYEDATYLAKDLSDRQLAFTTLNEYWLEKLGDSVKPREEVEIRSETLGEGTFGRVVRGKLRVACNETEGTVGLAVKICQDDIEFEHMVSFVNEAILMKRLSHENILDLLGVVLQPSSAPLILTPYMAHGDLHKFLRHSRGIGIRRQLIGSRQLVNFGSQIAKGMEYLASQKVVHRDLAARNCLVDENLNVKIGDFGLAREIRQFDLYKMEGPTQLAVKWLALESLLYYIFTEKSDVWSFGIVLWELVTLGSQPYAGLDNYEVMPYLETGKRLPRPLRCPDDLYSIMQSCWFTLSEERPTFTVLVHKLEDYEQRLRPSCITFEFDEDTIEMADNCGLF